MSRKLNMIVRKDKHTVSQPSALRRWHMIDKARLVRRGMRTTQKKNTTTTKQQTTKEQGNERDTNFENSTDAKNAAPNRMPSHSHSSVIMYGHEVSHQRSMVSKHTPSQAQLREGSKEARKEGKREGKKEGKKERGKNGCEW